MRITLLLCFLGALPLSADCLLKPHSSSIEIYSESGSYRGSFSVEGVVAAAANGNTIAVLCNHGDTVEIYSASGSYRGSFSVQGGRHIQVSSERIAVTLADGRTEIYSHSGSYCGSF